MKVECQRPTCRQPQRWKATGQASPNRWGRMRAEFVCESCGWKFSSGLQEAIDACNVVRAEQGLEPVAFGVVAQESASPRSIGLSVPAPSLPMPIVRQPTAGFSPLSKLAADFKARQSGEREAGEEG